jgi:hypothetical protein
MDNKKIDEIFKLTLDKSGEEPDNMFYIKFSQAICEWYRPIVLEEAAKKCRNKASKPSRSHNSASWLVTQGAEYYEECAQAIMEM